MTRQVTNLIGVTWLMGSICLWVAFNTVIRRSLFHIADENDSGYQYNASFEKCALVLTVYVAAVYYAVLLGLTRSTRIEQTRFELCAKIALWLMLPLALLYTLALPILFLLYLLPGQFK